MPFAARRRPASAASDDTHKLLLELRDGKFDRMRADPGRWPAHRLHQHPGRLRHGLRLLRQRPQWRRAQPHARRNPGTAGPPAQSAAAAAAVDAPTPPAATDATSSSWAWASRWRTSTTCSTALDVATAKDGLGIGARHITISTVGLPAKIRQLADLGKQYHLAVSLHAPNDALRTQIVPTNDKTGLTPSWRRPIISSRRPAGR